MQQDDDKTASLGELLQSIAEYTDYDSPLDQKEITASFKLGLAFLNTASADEIEKNQGSLSTIKNGAKKAFNDSVANSFGMRSSPREEDVDLIYYASEFLARLEK